LREGEKKGRDNVKRELQDKSINRHTHTHPTLFGVLLSKNISEGSYTSASLERQGTG